MVRAISGFRETDVVVFRKVSKQLLKNNIFSVIFDTKERFDTGRKLFNLFGSREAFLRRGFTTAVQNVDGKVPDNSEEFIMFVRVGRRS